MRRICFTSILIVFLYGGCLGEPLPAWNKGKARSRIISFVRSVTDTSAPTFVPPAERIAVFDMDGTIFVERPLPVVVQIAVNALKQEAKVNPQLKSRQPWKAALNTDVAWIMKPQNIGRVLTLPFAGKSESEYLAHVSRTLRNLKHPRFDRSYPQTAFRPVLELMRYLEANKFRVYVVSGTETSLLRTLAGPVTGLAPERFIGTRMGLGLELHPGGVLYRRMDFIDGVRGCLLVDGAFNCYKGLPNLRVAKVLDIHYKLGRNPIFAMGNSSGDFEMLMSVRHGKKPGLALLLEHDDGAREYLYPGAQRKVDWARRAGKEGWVPVSMKKDFRVLFSR